GVGLLAVGLVPCPHPSVLFFAVCSVPCSSFCIALFAVCSVPCSTVGAARLRSCPARPSRRPVGALPRRPLLAALHDGQRSPRTIPSRATAPHALQRRSSSLASR